MGARLWVDRGGTFCDVLRWRDGEGLAMWKVPSDAAVVGALAAEEGAAPEGLTFGTTVATNALLERQGARTLLVVSEGFADLPALRDMTRPGLFEPGRPWPAPLCAAVLEVRGRVGARGERVAPLDLAADLARLPDLSGFEAAAVALLNSHADPRDERAVAEELSRAHPGLFISLGHLQSPALGYLARVETTLVDAAITPRLREAMGRDLIPGAARAICSDGSLTRAARLGAPDAALSGPAGGVLAVMEVARQAGFAGAVGLDMGGTSTDLCCVEVGAPPRRQGAARVGDALISRPALEVETIAAGGGSVLWRDAALLRVGPRSAGARPGPQCYGRGGPPTLTDAALALGLIDAAAFSPPLRPELVALPGDPAEFIELAREEMAAAVRRLAAARGVDLRALPLVSYGGAAGAHAAAVASKVGARVVLVHPYASALSAWGQTLAHEEEERLWPLWRPLADGAARACELALELARGLAQGLAQGAGGAGEAWGLHALTLEVRAEGRDHSFSLSLPAGLGEAGGGEASGGEQEWREALRAALAPEALAARYHEAHERELGFRRPEARLECVNLRARLRRAGGEGERPWARAHLHLDPWGLGAREVAGPARLDGGSTSVWVPAGWRARRREGLLWLTRDDGAGADAEPSADPAARTPYGAALWGARLMGVATEAGEHLRRLARSVNIRERLDFSCALFDAEGRLIANAPHVPVHLGAMGETVRGLITHAAREGWAIGEGAWLCNDPQLGGSHLPDLTVITPVWGDGDPPSAPPRWFVASRAHHADVGGSTPGSMPPRARHIDEEGLVFRYLPLLTPRAPGAPPRLRDLRDHIRGARQPETLLADLEAQVASNAYAARALRALGAPALVSAWMGHLRAAAREGAEELTRRLPARGEARDDLDGVPLCLRVSREEGPEGAARLRLDLRGTGAPHPGNLNAPTCVARAAALYALRALAGGDLPLNEGALEAVELLIPSPSLLAPPAGAAVAGGNVETSQRLVDLILSALGARACSQGTMNNLTLGGVRERAGGGEEAWSLYETLGGGGGASAGAPGVSGLQVHMTNTRATDPEVLEARLPLRVWRMSLRAGSGGAGLHAGGEGLVRELEVLSPALAALLAARRPEGAPGLSGGGRGAPGEDHLCRAGVWAPWSGEPALLAPGDRVRVCTPGGGGWGGGWGDILVCQVFFWG